MTKNEVSIQESQVEKYQTKETIFDGYYTKTTHFLLAGLGINPNSNIFKNHFLNTYIDDAGLEHNLRNPLFLLLKTREFDDSWKKLEAILKSMKFFVMEYDVGMDRDNYLVMFVFEFPEIYAPDYYKFLAGEYSKFSAPYKRLFKKEFTNDRGVVVENTIYGVVYKTPTLKKRIESRIGETFPTEAEYWEQMAPEREIYRYNI